MGTLPLTKKIHVDGKEVDNLQYDFEAMTAQDLIDTNKEMQRLGITTSTLEELDPTYHLCLFAKAAQKASSGKVVLEDVLRLSAKDAKKAGENARRFFYLADLAD